MGTAAYNGSMHVPLTKNVSANASVCGGTTVNIPDATLNWWYYTDLDFPVATISAQFNNNDSLTGWTVLAATTTFNVTSALAEPTYSVITEFNTYYNYSSEYLSLYTTDPPDYVSTAVITQTATKALNASSGTGDIPPLDAIIATPAPASTVIPGPSSAAVTALTNTPFVYFSSFAIDVEKPTRVANGSLTCSTSRQMHALQSPFALFYADEDPEGQSQVLGDLPDEFLNELHALKIPLANLKLGTYAAEPTLLVVVEEVYVAQAVLAASAEEASSTPMLASAPQPLFFTLAPQVETSAASLMLPPSTTGRFIQGSGLNFLAQTEVTGLSLLLPSPTTDIGIPQITGSTRRPAIVAFTAVIEKSQTTLLAPSNSEGVITTTVQGDIIITAKLVSPTGAASPPPPPSQQQPPPTSNINIGELGGIITAIQSGANAQGSSQAAGSGGNGPGSNNDGTGSSGSGTGTNSNPEPVQQSPGLAHLFSAIQQLGQSSVPQATSGAGTGSHGNDGTGGGGSGNSESAGGPLGSSSSGDSFSGDTSSGGNSQSGGSSNGQAGSNSDLDSGSSGSVLAPIAVTIGGVRTAIGPASNAVFGSQTLVPGGPAVTISGTPVQIGPSAIIIGTKTVAFSASSFQKAPSPISGGSQVAGSGPDSEFPAAITVEGSTVTRTPAPVFIVDGQTVEQGRTIIVNNKAISIGSGGALVIDGSSISMAIPGSPETFTSVGETIVISSTPAYVFGSGETLLPGGAAVSVGGTQFSLAPSATALVVDGSVTSDLSPPETNAPLALTIGSDTLTANAATQFLLAPDNILTPGGLVTISGTTIGLQTGGSVAVINGVTQTLSHPTITPAPQLTVGGTVFEPNLGSTFEISGQELTPGGDITVSGTTISLAADASLVAINGVTETLSAPTHRSSTPHPTPAVDLTLGNEVFTAESNSTFVVFGSTLTPGGVITLGSGSLATTVSLGSSGAGYAVVNGVTSTVARVPTITAEALTIAGQIYSADASGEYVISGKTLLLGGSSITVTAGGSVETIALAQDGSAILVNGVPSTIAPAPTITAAPQITVDGQIINPVAGIGTTYLVSGKVLTPGGSVVFSGPNGVATVALSPDGSTLMEAVSGAITTSALPTAFAIARTAPPVITVGDEAFTALPGFGPSYLLPDGQTLQPGGSALTETIHGSTYIISLSPSATILVVEDVGSNGAVTKTEFDTLFPATITKGRGTTTAVVDGDGTGTSTQPPGKGASQTGDPASLQGAALSDKEIGRFLATVACGVAIFAILLQVI